MKRIKLFFIVLVFIFLLSSCDNKASGELSSQNFYAEVMKIENQNYNQAEITHTYAFKEETSETKNTYILNDNKWVDKETNDELKAPNINLDYLSFNIKEEFSSLSFSISSLNEYKLYIIDASFKMVEEKNVNNSTIIKTTYCDKYGYLIKKVEEVTTPDGKSVATIIIKWS